MTTMTSGIPAQHEPVLYNATRQTDTLLYSTGESALGKILVARSEAGVCAILLGSSKQELQVDLAARFPDSAIFMNPGVIAGTLAKVIRFLDDPTEDLDFGLDLRGTPFQRQVWQAIKKVPRGTTVTYADLAKRIGSPRSIRAVASACASNALALAVPCHRILRSDGHLAGYRWGIERKQELLRKEAMA